MDLNEFFSYAFSFYGKDGVYDMGATREQIAYATGVLVARLNSDGDEFEGDSVDRERVRDIMMEEFNLAVVA